MCGDKKNNKSNYKNIDNNNNENIIIIIIIIIVVVVNKILTWCKIGNKKNAIWHVYVNPG